jgi:acylphosphatase
MPLEEKPVRLHMIVSGHVQGVGFRAFVLDQALRLGLNGWVRNRLFEQVELVAEGPHAVLSNFMETIKRGPRMSYVSDATIEWSAATGEFKSFQVVRSF